MWTAYHQSTWEEATDLVSSVSRLRSLCSCREFEYCLQQNHIHPEHIYEHFKILEERYIEMGGICEQFLEGCISIEYMCCILIKINCEEYINMLIDYIPLAVVNRLKLYDYL